MTLTHARRNDASLWSLMLLLHSTERAALDLYGKASYSEHCSSTLRCTTPIKLK